MIISVDPNSIEPLYLQIYGAIISAIASGELEKGSNLPSSRKLARDLGVNYHTVHKAYALLENEGFVVTERKRVTVTGPTERGKDLFVERWRNIQMELILEAKAKGIPFADLLEMFKKLTSQGVEQ